MGFEIRPFPEFSWSQSRRSMFQDCPRRYFWNYYGSHNGWIEHSPAGARAAWRLKKISNLHMTLGNVVHEIAADALSRVRGGTGPPTAPELIEEGRGRLNRAWVLSQQREEWERSPGRHPMLMEFYRGSGPSGDLVQRIRNRLYDCLRNLPESESFREAAEAPRVEIREVDRLDFVELDGVKLYAQPDLLYRLGDAWRIVDWKTGASDKSHAAQLRTYSLYLRLRGDLPPGPIIGRREYLEKGTAVSEPITDRDIENETQSIRDSVAAMRTYLQDPIRNVPKSRESFPLTDNRRRCPSCNFFELCEAELAATETAGPF